MKKNSKNKNKLVTYLAMLSMMLSIATGLGTVTYAHDTDNGKIGQSEQIEDQVSIEVKEKIRALQEDEEYLKKSLEDNTKEKTFKEQKEEEEFLKIIPSYFLKQLLFYILLYISCNAF